MRSVLQTWREQQPGMLPPQGRWAIQRNTDNAVIGGVGIGPLPPDGEDLEVRWQLNPNEWGKGYAAEAARGLIAWAFTQEIDELFAVARPNNVRAVATVQRLGMQWVGETTKYYGLNLQVYRIRPNDFRLTRAGNERVGDCGNDGAGSPSTPHRPPTPESRPGHPSRRGSAKLDDLQ
jgi:RimJ/RimL family protein N-acetyltransferase